MNAFVQLIIFVSPLRAESLARLEDAMHCPSVIRRCDNRFCHILFLNTENFLYIFSHDISYSYLLILLFYKLNNLAYQIEKMLPTANALRFF